ncbi:MAG: hypothetical protein ACRECH_10655 [Nitrososphaerales archaeon]
MRVVVRSELPYHVPGTPYEYDVVINRPFRTADHALEFYNKFKGDYFSDITVHKNGKKVEPTILEIDARKEAQM